MQQSITPPSGFRDVPLTGVIFVMTEAARRGYHEGSTEWFNLGQGAPETGEIPDGPPRLSSITINTEDNEYSPVNGLPELRDAVANLYNSRYRQGKKSQYTRDNVAISGGGRLALTRLVSTVGRTNVGHFLPDYTAYEELLDAFGTFVPIPIMLDPKRNYEFRAAELKAEILGRGLSAVLLSNPCNPTGQVIHGDRLENWLNVAREVSCTLIFDEFYSHFIYDNDDRPNSAAFHVDNVEEDPLVITSGLTKNWRYPGWRISWTIGPAAIIRGITSAGSFLDGGAPRPLQRAALPLLEPENADAEARAIQRHFGAKRRILLDGLAELGMSVNPEPKGGFYCWADLRQLPDEFNTGRKLFERALDVGVIVVPGSFFDINPGQRRPGRPSRFRHFARFSFGPPEAEIRGGLERLRELLK